MTIRFSLAMAYITPEIDYGLKLLNLNAVKKGAIKGLVDEATRCKAETTIKGTIRGARAALWIKSVRV